MGIERGTGGGRDVGIIVGAWFANCGVVVIEDEVALMFGKPRGGAIMVESLMLT